MSQVQPLANQVAIVTGGGRGLGQAYAIAIAKAGAAVAVVSRSEEHLEKTVALGARAGGTIRAYPGDVTNPIAVDRIVASVTRDLGPVDLLVNAAGTAEPLGPLVETDPDAWWKGIETNVRGPYLFARHLLPGMIERGRGRIVNISSGIGTSAYPYLSAYSVGKTALIRLTESLAAELESTGVSVFSISPGMVKTAMIDSLASHPRAKEFFPWTLKNLAGGGVTPAESSATLVVRLATGEADALSGRHISVFVDLDALIQRADEAKDRKALLLRLVGLE
ncbi:MAG TPA: SDR family oxidoreductase [Candidatus Eisenbacteria bacterium]|nr:SDR family oxidoreductase [Candidatus Eisenbacteria bacterium]